MDGSSSMKAGHTSWLALSTTQEPTSPSRKILQTTQVANLLPADSSCIKQGPYSRGACYHHPPLPSTSCAYDYHHHDFSRPTYSPIRPDNTAAEIGAGQYRQRAPPILQDRSPSGALQHAGKKASPPPPRHAIQLMGVLMSPEVAPSSSEMVASNKQDANMFARPSATFTSQNTADGTTVAPLEDYRLRSLQKETDHISLPGLHDRDGPENNLPQDHAGTGHVAAENLSSGVISGRQDESPEMTGWERLKFDVSVFQSPFADPDKSPFADSDRQKILQIVDLIHRLNRGGELQMNAQQFREFHVIAFKTSLGGRDTTSKTNRGVSRKKRLAASKSLYESRKLWYQRWATMLHHPRRLSALTLQLQYNTQNETLALTFLFFVEMITSVVISPERTENVVDEQLDKALEILEGLFDPSSSSSLSARLSDQASNLDHESTPLHPHTRSTLSDTEILNKLPTNTFEVYSALWLLLQRWMYTHRPHLARIIIPMRKKRMFNVKAFFNTIFYLSINNFIYRYI